MNKKTLHDQLIEELRNRVPNNSELVNLLTDFLDIGKEAAYRRLRGEVQFSLEEASTLAYNMGLSLDALKAVSALKRPFVFKIANFADPQEIDYDLINEFADFLEYIKDNTDTEMAIAAKILPDAIHLGHPHLTRFYLFKWMYQYDNQKLTRKYEEVNGGLKVLEILNRMAELLLYIKKTSYIFDRRIFENLVDDIKYFNTIELINENDMQLLKKDLFACLDDLEIQAATGINRVGNKTEIYLSNINFEAGFSYVSSKYHKVSTIRAFTLYDIASSDTIAFDKSQQWMQSLKRASMLISESGEIARKSFFNKQRELVSTL
ncbi:hypothetical protein [Prevotella sp. 10(H)]|uniref:hypothetical protein n=1 Tax=Prevotella sp. 10(H) TaxID=1158294 RepID=UPI0004A74A45|nr:hypothetical protein [Prevotella sp. 10(H)]